MSWSEELRKYLIDTSNRKGSHKILLLSGNIWFYSFNLKSLKKI